MLEVAGRDYTRSEIAGARSENDSFRGGSRELKLGKGILKLWHNPGIGPNQQAFL